MRIGRAEATAIIGEERLRLLRECVFAGWTRYEAVFRPEIPACSAGEMPGIIHELVAEQARQRLRADMGFAIRDRRDAGGRFLVEIDGRLVVQFKKLTEDFLTTNNPTPTSQAFDRQEPGLFEIPDSPRLTVGYHFGPYRTSIAAVYLAFVVGDKCEWHYNLETGEHSIEFEFPEFEFGAAEQEQREEGEQRAAEENPDDKREA